MFSLFLLVATLVVVCLGRSLDLISSFCRCSSGATGSAATPGPAADGSGTTVKTEATGDVKVKAEGAGAASVSYDLGKRHFAHTAYGEFGAEGVDTLDTARKRLRAEAFGGGADALPERILQDRKVVLKKDLPLLLPPARLAALQKTKGGIALKAGENSLPRASLTVPNVTWSLLDGK